MTLLVRLRQRKFSWLILSLSVKGNVCSRSCYQLKDDLIFWILMRQIYRVFNVKSLFSSLDLSLHPRSSPVRCMKLVEELKKNTVLSKLLLGEYAIQLFNKLPISNFHSLVYYHLQFLQLVFQEMIDQKEFVCLNPECPNPTQAILTLEQISDHKKCLTWIATPDGPLYMPPLADSPLKGPMSIIFGEGVHSIYQILKFKEWPQQIKIIFQQMKERTLNEIELVKNQKIKEFQQLYKEASKAILELKQVFQKKVHNKQVFCGLVSLKSLQNRISLNLFQFEKIRYFYDKKLVKDIKYIGELVQSFGQTFEQAEQRRRKLAIEKTNQYFFQKEQIQINDKIQKLANLFKAQMVKVTFDPQLGSFKANCWICNSVIDSEKKDPSKLKCLQQMFLHLTTSHRRQIYLNFMSKVLRYEIEQVGFEALVKKIDEDKIKLVIIIDRENAGLVERPLEIDKNTVWIEVVNKDNKNLAKGMYLVANSNRKDSSDILITFLVYEMLKSEVESVTLVTGDHFGVTLQEVIGGIRLKCVEPKDFVEKNNSSMTE